MLSRMEPAERDARTNHYLANPSQLRADLAAGSAEMWAQMDRRYRIYCLSARPDSQLMWGHYAEHHRGVCSEFDTHTPDFCSATEVTYNVTYPNFLLCDDNTDLSPFYTKSSDWVYEEEYRLIAQEASEALGSGTLMTHDDGMFEFSESALVSVIVGFFRLAKPLMKIGLFLDVDINTYPRLHPSGFCRGIRSIRSIQGP